jgi:catechol 2,3-dioxygenase-like lactoylglutathione lyase family enzyme
VVADEANGRDAERIVEELDLVFYWVSDMERALAFYQDTLGLPLVRRDAQSWALFELAGGRFALHAAAEGQAVTPGGATAVFSVHDLDAARAGLADRGVRSSHEGDVEGYARFASFQDPDGNTFQLIEYARPQAPTPSG